jgi:uncharacterized protein (TIGR02246 family)
MSKITYFGFLIGGILSMIGGCKMNGTKDEKVALAAIQELHAKDIEASKARDFDTLLSLWTEDGVLLEPGKKPTVGIEAIKAYMEAQKEASKAYRIKKYEHRWEEIKVIGDWAFEWGYFDAVAEMTATGELIEQRGKLLRLLKKRSDGSWKVARVIAHNDSKA